MQVLTNNRRIDPVEFENTMLMHLRGDDMDRLREEYNQIVRERTEWSNNIFREKYVVLSVQRRSIEEARSFFARAGTELASGFGRLSSQLTEDVYKRQGLRCPENRKCSAGGTVCGIVLPHTAARMAFPIGGLVDGAVRAAVRRGAGPVSYTHLRGIRLRR